MSNNISLNKKQQLAIDLINSTKKNIFIHGKAGVGKSTLLNAMYELITKKKVVFLGSTGTAAVNIGGRTVHSFFGLDYNMVPKYLSHKKIDAIKSAEVIVIDEISMIRADLMDTINILLQKVMGNKKPCGGKQFVVVGDLLQLAPVVKTSSDKDKDFFDYYETSFFIGTETYKLMDFVYIGLDEVYRQKGGRFLDILNDIRKGKIREDDLALINKQVIRKKEDFNPKTIFVGSINKSVDKINEEKLAKLKTKEFFSAATIYGKYDVDIYPAPKELIVKEGARIMFVKNTEDYKNGTLGTIEKIDVKGGEIKVKTDDGITVYVTKSVWELKEKLTEQEQKDLLNIYGPDLLPEEYEVDEENGIIEKVLGTFEQFPLKLGYGITIHRSQGKTFDSVVIDMGNGAFAEGQTYVALSRCKTLEGIQLIKPIKRSDIMVNKYVLDFVELMETTE